MHRHLRAQLGAGTYADLNRHKNRIRQLDAAHKRLSGRLPSSDPRGTPFGTRHGSGYYGD